jgi:hypothetical protein
MIKVAKPGGSEGGSITTTAEGAKVQPAGVVKDANPGLAPGPGAGKQGKGNRSRNNSFGEGKPRVSAKCKIEDL